MMMKLIKFIPLVLILSGCALGTVDHGYAPYKNKYGEEVVYVRLVQFSHMGISNTAPVGNVGQVLSGVVGVTPIVGDILGRAVASTATGERKVPWVLVQVVRGDKGEDNRRYFAAVYTQPYQGIHEIKEKSWVRYIPMQQGRDTAYVYACEIETDCLPVQP